MVYLSKTAGLNRRGRALGRCEDGAGEFVSKRGTDRVRQLEKAERECQDRKRWRLFYHPLVGAPGEMHLGLELVFEGLITVMLYLKNELLVPA